LIKGSVQVTFIVSHVVKGTVNRTDELKIKNKIEEMILHFIVWLLHGFICRLNRHELESHIVYKESNVFVNQSGNKMQMPNSQALLTIICIFIAISFIFISIFTYSSTSITAYIITQYFDTKTLIERKP